MDMPQQSTDWPHRRVIALRCTANQCQQGRTPCPVPEACQLAEEADHFERRAMQALVFWLAILLVVIGFIAGYAWGWLY